MTPPNWSLSCFSNRELDELTETLTPTQGDCDARCH